MNLKNLKIKDSDIGAYGVVAAPDKLTGTAQENKAVFDRLIRECVSERFNALIEQLHVIGNGELWLLPIASADTLGGIKVGKGLAIDKDGTLSVTATGTADLPDGDGVSY